MVYSFSVYFFIVLCISLSFISTVKNITLQKNVVNEACCRKLKKNAAIKNIGMNKTNKN